MQKQRFSLRKYKFGLASVVLGTFLVIGAAQVQAEEQVAAKPVVAQETNVVTTTEATTQSATASENTESEAEKTDSSVATPAETPQQTATAQVAEVTSSSPAEVSSNAEEQPAPEDTNATKEETTSASQPEATSTEAESTSVTNSSAAPTTKAEPAKTPVSDEARPASVSSNEIIKVPQTWHQGYKGEGTVVAIIDSGLDVHHEVLRITDPSKGKYKTEAEMEAVKRAAGIDYGKWYNDKVVYAYDYMDGDDNIKEKDTSSHGMHVTGIATGNPDKKSANGEYVYGVAPEAQVMFMRVFSDRSGTTSSAIYAKAIDDAVALGADSINMSLGSSTGSTVNADPSIVDAIKRARAKGVSVLISAGNSNTFGYGYDKPLAENPDYGLVGNPSTVEDSISVASVNNTVVTEEVFNVLGLENNAELNHGKFTYAAAETEGQFEKGKEYEYVDAGLGREEDFSGVDVKGKLALVQRGSITFAEKANNALKHGATGILVYNNVAGANVTMALDGEGKKNPAVFSTS